MQNKCKTVNKCNIQSKKQEKGQYSPTVPILAIIPPLQLPSSGPMRSGSTSAHAALGAPHGDRQGYGKGQLGTPPAGQQLGTRTAGDLSQARRRPPDSLPGLNTSQSVGSVPLFQAAWLSQELLLQTGRITLLVLSHRRFSQPSSALLQRWRTAQSRGTIQLLKYVLLSTTSRGISYPPPAATLPENRFTKALCPAGQAHRDVLTASGCLK